MQMGENYMDLDNITNVIKKAESLVKTLTASDNFPNHLFNPASWRSVVEQLASPFISNNLDLQ